MVHFLERGLARKECGSRRHMIHRVETYVHGFGRPSCWSLQQEFKLQEPASRRLAVMNLRDPLERMWSLYNFEQRYKRTIGWNRNTLQNSSSPVWVVSPEKYFEMYPDNFYVRVLCCANNKGTLMTETEKLGLSHLERAKQVLEHEVGIIGICEWYADPRFQHYLYSTLNLTKVKSFECFRQSFDMAAGQKEVLGKIEFADPEFEDHWRKKKTLDFQLYLFARRLAWQRASLFWDSKSGELLPVINEPRVSKYSEWTEDAKKPRAQCR